MVVEESEYSEYDEKLPNIDSHVSETRAFTTKESFGSIWKNNTADKGENENTVQRISFKNIPTMTKVSVLDMDAVQEEEP